MGLARPTDHKQIFLDKDIDTVVIATRHDSHAEILIDSLNASKFTIVEKPLALNYSELKQIARAVKQNPKSSLFVGFNRRFSPHLKKVKQSLGMNKNPINIVATMNAGFIPNDHWVQTQSLEEEEL